MRIHLLVGGLVAAGLDNRGDYLLTISHSGRGLYSTKSWQRIARDYELAYPVNGVVCGIGPVEGEAILVTEMDFNSGSFQLVSNDGQTWLTFESDGITVELAD